LIYYIKSNDKIISYYRIKVWPLMSDDVVILEVMQEVKNDFRPEYKDVGKFCVRSFLSASDYSKMLPYPNELVKLPMDEMGRE